MIRTGIMGGTFDPIHTGHLILARYALELLELDEVWFMTSGNPPHKRDTKHTDAKTRHEMVRLAIKDCDGFMPCDYEVKREEYSYSALTLKAFNEMYPDREFYFIIGQDSLNYFDKWYHPEEILKYSKAAVYPRRSEVSLEDEIKRMEGLLGARFIRLDAPMIELSSTEIRKRVGDTKSIKFMVPEAVEKYIREKGLYQ